MSRFNLGEDYEHLFSINEAELTMVAERIISSLGCEATDHRIGEIIEVMRQPLYKTVDLSNTELEKIKEEGAERLEEEKKIVEEEKREAEEEAKRIEDEKKALQHGILPDDHEPDDNLLFGFGLMQLLMYRMERVKTFKKISLCVDQNDLVALRAGDSNVNLNNGRVRFVADRYSTEDAVFDLMEPNSVGLVVDRIFLDS